MGILDGLKNAWRKRQERRTIEKERGVKESEDRKLKREEPYFQEMGRQQAVTDLRERKEKIASRDLLEQENKWGFVKGIWKKIKKT